MVKNSNQLEIEGTQQASLRVHSQNRRYSAENTLTCERTSFQEFDDLLYLDHLNSNLMELGKFVKDEMFLSYG